MQKTRVWHTDIVNYDNQIKTKKTDLLAVEEPLEIRLVADQLEKKELSVAVTMRTPGNDFELALGFLFTEGIIQDYDDVSSVQYCNQVKSAEEEGNVVKVYLNESASLDIKKLDRNFYMTSSCGVCGKASIEALEMSCDQIASDLKLERTMLTGAPITMRQAQQVFEHTGGLHASALFDKSGKLILLREDIGRHNALDKIIGAAFIEKLLPLSDYFVLVSGRVGFELVQKSIAAGLPVIGAIGAPSSLAVETAKSYGLTLAGFIKNEKINIYSREDRIV